MTEKTLKIKIGEEYKVKVENIGEFNKSMFKDLYDKAFDCIDSILKSKVESEYEKYNNIVSFVGERGTGKTSAMLSVSGALKDEYSTEFKKEIFKGLKNNDKPKYTFNEIGVIDPSHFDENSNILEIILAKMFKSFKNKVEEKNSNSDHDDKRKLIKAFEEVFENLKTIQNPENIYKGESLDALLKMSASTDLKENMTNLVKKYLKFFNNSDNSSDKPNAILLLEIDDIDLSTKHAYEMVEQVRKYLIIPNVVILMAVKMDQLSHIVERNMRQEFEIMLEKPHMNDEEPKNMAEKYLMKLIPLERRLFLPNFDNVNLDMMMEVKTKKNSIEKIIRKDIYDKTGMMFFNTTTQVSYIVPRNLREIVNLVSRLDKMPILEIINTKGTEEEIEKQKEKNKNTKIKNFHEFREYFLNHWVEENLEDNQKSIIKEIYTRDVEEKNKCTVRILDEIYENEIKKEIVKEVNRTNKSKNIEEYNYIIESLNNSENVSLGDVLVVLDIINKMIRKDRDKKFIFAIKTLYSILLYNYIRKIKMDDEEKEHNIFMYKKLLNGYIHNLNFHKIFGEKKVRKIEKQKYKKEFKVEKWLDYFITWRGSKKYNGNPERYRMLERKHIYSDEVINGESVEFNYLGFLSKSVDNDLENGLYIGNIEMLEKILKFKYKISEDEGLFYNVVNFIEKLLQYVDEKIQRDCEFKERTLIYYDDKNKMKIRNNYLQTLLCKTDLRKETKTNLINIFEKPYKFEMTFESRRKHKDALINNIDIIKTKIENQNIENVESIKNALEEFKDEIVQDRYEGKDKILLQLEMKLAVTKILENEIDIREIERKIEKEKKIMDYIEKAEEIMDKEDSIFYYTKAIELDNKYSEYYYDRGCTYLVSEKYKEAISDFNEAIKLEPSKARYYSNRGRSKYKQEKYDEAIKDFDEAIKLDSNKAEYYFGRGKCRHKQEKWEEAEKDYDEAIKLDSSKAKYYNHRGKSKFNQDKYDEALTDYDEAIKLDSNTADYYNCRAKALYELGNYEESLLDCNKAIELNPTNGIYYHNKGKIKQHFKKYEEAFLNYNKAVNLEPNNETIKKNRKDCIKEMNEVE